MTHTRVGSLSSFFDNINPKELTSSVLDTTVQEPYRWDYITALDSLNHRNSQEVKANR